MTKELRMRGLCATYISSSFRNRYCCELRLSEDLLDELNSPNVSSSDWSGDIGICKRPFSSALKIEGSHHFVYSTEHYVAV